MGRNKNKANSRSRTNQGTPQSRRAPATLSAAAEKAEDLKMVRALAATQDTRLADALTVERLPAPPWSETDQERSLLQAFDVLEDRRKAYEACAQAADERHRPTEERAERLIAEQQIADVDRRRAADAVAEANALRQEAADQIDALRTREERVRVLETEARAGFESQAAAARADLVRELADRRTVFDRELAAERERVKARADEWERELESERETMLADIRVAEEGIRHETSELARREEQIRYDRGALRGQELDLANRETALEAEVTARAAAAIAEAERQQHLTHVRAEAAESLTKDLTDRLTKLEGALLKLGNTDPVHLLDERDQLKAANDELRNQLAARLADDDLDRLRWLEERNRDLSAERERLSYELQQLKGNVLANGINNLKVRQLEDAERQFEVISRGYEARIAELRGTIEQLYNDRPDPGAPLFPQCVAMDDDASLAERGAALDEPVNLSRLTRSLQATMFHDSERVYRINDIAVFLGGLAMSRLHLLEGMSGIGKTSLPKAFAAALHTDCVVVEVQAGWRDRTDLFGHHNTFEKRFEESDFLQALYRAMTPRYRHRPFFIVLDEMNLSRPEQYFSVLLSKLENEDGKPIQLVTSSTGRRPTLFTDGIGLTLPDNIWFIGTANQDESTLEFADKTYNRAHLMELPAHRPWVARSDGGVQPYSLDSLRTAFTAVQAEYRGATKTVRELIHGLSDDLWEQGRLQMSPRVEEQLRTFVPVVVAASAGDRPREGHDYGDSAQDGVALAADHFLAYKVLRAVRGRFDVTSERIEALRESVAVHWSEASLSGEPVRCIRMFDEEQRRREG